jgi:hypothetical protein
MRPTGPAFASARLIFCVPSFRGNTVNSPEAIRSANSNCFCCSSNLSASLTSSSLSPALPFNAAATSRVCLPFTVSIHQPNCQSMDHPTATKFLRKKPTFPPQSASPSPPNTSLVKVEGKNTFASMEKILHIHKLVLLSTILKEKHSHINMYTLTTHLRWMSGTEKL